MARLPIPGDDNGQWGGILNEYLAQSLDNGGVLKSGSVGTPQLQSDAVTATKLKSGSVTASKLAADAPTASQILSFDGSSLAWVTPSTAGPVPDAGSSTKGLVKLAGDLAGTADAPTVPALSSKEPLLTAGDLSQYYRGDKSWQPLNKAAVLLPNVDNTSDINKPISAATQTALNSKAESDDLATKADDISVVHLAGNETITGVKNYTGTLQSYGQAVVITTDSRLSNERIPANDSVAAAKLQDGAVTEPKLAIGNEPVDGQVLSFSGTGMAWTTPAEGAGDATTGAKGVLQLAGDLAGTADAPTVPALATKEPSLAVGTTNQYYRGDKTWQTLNKNSVGLGNIDNTADSDKPLSNDTIAALTAKANANEVVLLAGDQLVAGAKNYVGSLQAGGQEVVTTNDARLSNQRTPNDNSVSATKLQNGSVTEQKLAVGSVPSDGQFLSYQAGELTWYTLDSSVADATDALKGVLQLSGDLSGTADAPTVPGLLTKEPTILAGTTAQYYRGDKSWQVLTKTSVGLADVDNTSDAAKPVSSAAQTALDAKASQAAVNLKAEDTLVVHLAGNETITGVKNYTGTLQAYGQAVVTTEDTRLSDMRVPTDASVTALKLQDNVVGEPKLDTSNSPTNDQILSFNNGDLTWITPLEAASDASGSVKGLIKLAGDLSGSADLPTVPGLATKEPIVSAGTTMQYYRGDKTWQTLNRTAFNLEYVDNTSDIEKPISTTTQAALTTKVTNPMTTVGDLIVGAASGSPASVAAVVTGNSLLSGGVAATPVWGKVGLTTHISGVLSVDNGGSGRSTATTAYGLLAAGTTATGSQQTLSTGTTGQILKSNGAAALPTFQTGAKADVGLSLVDNTSDATKNSATATLTNKRVNPRTVTVVSSATVTPTSDTADFYTVTALAINTTISAPTGAPVNGQRLTIRITDNGSSQTLTWNAVYKPVGANLPTTTTAGKTAYVWLVYNTTVTKWDVIAVNQET